MATITNDLRIYEVGACFAWEDEEDDPVQSYTCLEANTNHGVVVLRFSTRSARDLRMSLRDLALPTT